MVVVAAESEIGALLCLFLTADNGAQAIHERSAAVLFLYHFHSTLYGAAGGLKCGRDILQKVHGKTPFGQNAKAFSYFKFKYTFIIYQKSAK